MQGKPAANDNLESMAIPTEIPTADPLSQTDVSVQGNLLGEYEQKFAKLPEDQRLTKPCSDAGLSKNIDKRQFFITLMMKKDLDDMKTSCQEYTLPRSEEKSRVRGWIRGNTNIGPVLDVKVCYHQGRYGVEIMIESLFRYRTVSFVGSHRERNQQTRDRNVRRNSCCKR